MDAVRVLGGPYDGAEIDVDYLFGGEPRGKLAIRMKGRRFRLAFYELDIDAAGECYRYVGCPTPPARLRSGNP